MLNGTKQNFVIVSCLLQAPSLDDKVNLHFIAFVNVGGQLYELGKFHMSEELVVIFHVVKITFNNLIAH